jgi:hypothetical protein
VGFSDCGDGDFGQARRGHRPAIIAVAGEGRCPPARGAAQPRRATRKP